jgi:predicted O-methyltransferase YrrM
MSRFYSDNGPKAAGQKVCLATTCYTALDAGYVFSLQASREALHKAGIQTAYFLLQGNCHVDDARNRIVQAFLQSDCTDLIFLDADVSWRTDDLIDLCKYDRDLVGGVYPYRRPDKEDDLPARMMDGAEIDGDGLIEMEGIPTGFMRIKRHVIERMIEGAKHYDDENGRVYVLFERALVNGTRWGGDLNFCNLWRALGGQIYAAPEMVFGHAGLHQSKNSMAAIVRKRCNLTLRHVANKIRAGNYTMRDLTEAIEYVGNRRGAREDVLALSIKLAKEAAGPIIESGSGLTTVLMAAATTQPVYCLEHDPLYAAKLRELCALAGVSNVGLCVVPLRDGWYDLDDFNGLPESFAFGLNDGPPRQFGDRMKFFDRIDCPLVVCDDAESYDFTRLTGHTVEHITERAAVVRRA